MVGSATAKEWNDEILSSKPIIHQSDELHEFFTCALSSVKAKKVKKITPKILAKLWCINENLADKALEQNTHVNKQSADNLLFQQYLTNDRIIQYKPINSLFYTNKFSAKNSSKSVQGNTCMQVFVSNK